MHPFLQPKLYINLKIISCIAFFLLAPLVFFAQTLTGLWIGSLSNDSNTVRKDQSFEIALTEYRGKVYGYSRSEFIVNDTLYYIMKRVKGTIEGDKCEVIDDEIISYNFRGKLDKGIKVTSTFLRNQSDSTWYLAGTWKTNATKKYYAVTGKVKLAEEKDLTASKIFPHLEELNLADEVVFYKERKESVPVIKLVKPENEVSSIPYSPDLNSITNKTGELSAAKPELKRAETDSKIADSLQQVAQLKEQEDLPAVKKINDALPKTETKTVNREITAIKTAPPVNKQVNSPVVNKVDQQALPVKNNQQKPPVSNQPEKTERVETLSTLFNPVPEKKEVKIETIVTQPKPQVPKPDITVKAAVVEGRKSEFAQEVNFSSDSLVLSLYDNGEIDGDTVTIYMNNEILLFKQGLKASAIKKTIYLTPGKDDEFTLVLFADNLGKYPPNTGLLVIKDGNNTYNLRFSADFQKNAGVVFRRKK